MAAPVDPGRLSARLQLEAPISTDDGQGSRVDFSRADRALAAIRRRIAASTGRT